MSFNAWLALTFIVSAVGVAADKGRDWLIDIGVCEEREDRLLAYVLLVSGCLTATLITIVPLYWVLEGKMKWSVLLFGAAAYAVVYTVIQFRAHRLAESSRSRQREMEWSGRHFMGAVVLLCVGLGLWVLGG